MERTDPTTAATGSSPTTAASSPSATRSSSARWAAMRLNQPVLGMERTASGNGLLAVRARRRRVHLRRRASSTARSAAPASTAPIVAMQRTPSGHGYWMLGSRRSMLRLRRRAATSAASVAARNYGGARRLLATPYRQRLLDRDGERLRDPVRRRAPARVPGPPQRLARRVDAQSVRRGGVAAPRRTLGSAQRRHPWGARGNRAERVATSVRVPRERFRAHDRSPPPTPRTCSG